jgi:uncharacterized C2H2 Zn-finger protein
MAKELHIPLSAVNSRVDTMIRAGELQPNKTALEKAEDIKMDKGRIRCPNCDKTYQDTNGLREHLVNGHGFSRRDAIPVVNLFQAEGDDIEKAKEDFIHLNDPIVPDIPAEETPFIPWHCMYCNEECEDESSRDLHESDCPKRPDTLPREPEPVVPSAPNIEELVLPFDVKDDCPVKESNAVHRETVVIPDYPPLIDSTLDPMKEEYHIHDEDDDVIRKDLEEHAGIILVVKRASPPSIFETLSRELVRLSGMMTSQGYKVEDMDVHENNGLVQIKFRAQKVVQ